MKILSKYKDYYDYLVGAKFGLDNNVILDRREGFVKDYIFIDQPEPIKLAIADKLYSGGVIGKNKILWNEFAIPYYHRDILDRYSIYHHWRHYMNPTPIKTEINQEENCPIVFVSGIRDQHRKNFPKLGNLGIASVIDAETMFTEIYNWQMRQKDKNQPDTRTDVQKLLGKGFDKKKSFRHRK